MDGGPPAEQIVFSQQVDCHLLQTLGIDIITSQFCDSCSIVGGEISYFQRIRYIFFSWSHCHQHVKYDVASAETFFLVLRKEVYLRRREQNNKAVLGEKKCVALDTLSDCSYTSHTSFKNNIIPSIQVEN